MEAIVVLGAGELGACLACGLLERGATRRIVLVDPGNDAAEVDARIERQPSLAAAGAADLIMVADPPALAERTPSAGSAVDLILEIVSALGHASLLFAGPESPRLVRVAVARGMARSRVLGSEPLAWVELLRQRLADELGTRSSSIACTLLGLPPNELILPQGSATVGGLPVERLSSLALRRAVSAIGGARPGTRVLCEAALTAVDALRTERPTALPVVAGLAGEYGQRGIALAVPAMIGSREILSIVEYPLEPVDRVAFDRAAQRAESQPPQAPWPT